MAKPETTKHILLICRKAPYGNSLARETLDIALACAVFDQQLSMLFLSDGVWQLLNKQDSAELPAKNLEKILSAFSLYGIEDIFADQQALTERNLDRSDLAIECELLTESSIAKLMTDADIIIHI